MTKQVAIFVQVYFPRHGKWRYVTKNDRLTDNQSEATQFDRTGADAEVASWRKGNYEARIEEAQDQKQAREIVVGVFSDGEGFEIREQASTREEVANLIREELASLGEDADACINEHGIKFEGDPEMKDYILTLTADQYNRLQLVLERKVTQIRQSIEDGLDDEPENEGLAAEMQDLQMIADCLRSQH